MDIELKTHAVIASVYASSAQPNAAGVFGVDAVASDAECIAEDAWRPSISALLGDPVPYEQSADISPSACEKALGTWQDEEQYGNQWSGGCGEQHDAATVARAMLSLYMHTRSYARQVQSVLDFAMVHRGVGLAQEGGRGGLTAAELASIAKQLSFFLSSLVDYALQQHPFAAGTRNRLIAAKLQADAEAAAGNCTGDGDGVGEAEGESYGASAGMPRTLDTTSILPTSPSAHSHPPPPRYVYTFFPFQFMMADIVGGEYNPGTPTTVQDKALVFLFDAPLHAKAVDMLKHPVLLHEWSAVRTRVRQLKAVQQKLATPTATCARATPASSAASLAVESSSAPSEASTEPQIVSEPASSRVDPRSPSGDSSNSSMHHQSPSAGRGGGNASVHLSPQYVTANGSRRGAAPTASATNIVYAPSPLTYTPFSTGFGDLEDFSYDEVDDQDVEHPALWLAGAQAAGDRARRTRIAARAAAFPLRPLPSAIASARPSVPRPARGDSDRPMPAGEARDVLASVDPQADAPLEAADILRAHFEGMAMDVLSETVCGSADEDNEEDGAASAVFTRLLVSDGSRTLHGEKLLQALHTPDTAQNPLYLRLAYAALSRSQSEPRPEAKLACIIDATTVLTRGMVISGRESGRDKVRRKLQARGRTDAEIAGAGLGPGDDEGALGAGDSAFGADELLPATVWLVLQSHAARAGYCVWRRGATLGSYMEQGLMRMLLGDEEGHGKQETDLHPIPLLPRAFALSSSPGLSLPSTVSFIERFRDSNALMGAAGYTLTSLRSALAHVAHVADPDGHREQHEEEE